ncbi:MAG: hypothetical protein AB1349_09260 [Elusimicrobiota bacterium]
MSKRALLRFTFPKINLSVIRTCFKQAIRDTEFVFGKEKVKISFEGYHIFRPNKKGLRRLLIDVGTPVGEHIAKIFTGLLIKKHRRFRVERVFP